MQKRSPQMVITAVVNVIFLTRCHNTFEAQTEMI